MKFVADENVDRGVVERLRDVDGHDVLSVAEMEPGIGDDAVLSLANENGAILLTADKDFGELVYRQNRASAGVVLIRLAGLSVDAKAVLVSGAVGRRGREFPGAFTVISPASIRVRRAR